MKKLTISIFILLFSALLYGCGKVELSQDTITVELGEELPDIGAACLNTSSDKVLEKTTVQTHKVDLETVGSYEAYISYKSTYLTVTVIVEDTTPPEVALKDSGKYEIGVGNSLSSEDMIETAEDIAGIESVSFKDHQAEKPVKKGKEKKAERTDESGLPLSYVFYKESGTYDNELIVTDVNGNETAVPVEITITNEYEEHISGFEDLSVSQNTAPDWLSGISYDERIASVTADDSEVDMSTPGEYTLTYKITGDDKTTVFEVSVKVTVTEAAGTPASTTDTPSSDSGTSNNRGTTNDSGTSNNNSNSGRNSGNTGQNNNNAGSFDPPSANTPTEPEGGSDNLTSDDGSQGSSSDLE